MEKEDKSKDKKLSKKFSEKLIAFGVTLTLVCGIFGTKESMAAEISKDNNTKQTLLTDAPEKPSFQKLADITSKKYDFTSETDLYRYAKDIMYETPEMKKYFQDFEKTGIKIKITDKLESYGGYHTGLKQVWISNNAVKDLNLITENIKDSETEGFFKNMLMEEVIHGLSDSKIDTINLDAPSALMVYQAVEIEARTKIGLHALQVGGNQWEAISKKFPKEANEIENLLSANNIKVGEVIVNQDIKNKVTEKLAASFYSDGYDNESSISSAQVYQNSAFIYIAEGRAGEGDTSLSAKQILKTCDLDGHINPQFFFKNAIPTKAKRQKIAKEFNISKREMNKIPTMEDILMPRGKAFIDYFGKTK